MYLRVGSSCFILLTIIICTALARSNGRPPSPRHHRRRAATLSEFLTPPAPPSGNRPQYTQPSPFRHGKILNTVPSATPETSGFFARFMGWFNPWGGAPSPPPLPQNHHPGFQPTGKPHDTYGPPQFDSNGKPSSPQTVHSQPSQLSGKSCNPCNRLPWIPMFQGLNLDGRYGEGHGEIYAGDGGTSFHLPSPSHEVKIPDFGWNQAPPPSLNGDNHYRADYPSPITGPIPNPHLYPGAMPPLFKAVPWDSAPEASNHVDQLRNNGVAEVDTLAEHNSNLNNQFSQPNVETIHPPTGGSGEYVDVLPPGAEIATGSENSQNSQSGINFNTRFTDSGLHLVNQQSIEHETASASLNAVVDTLPNGNQGSSYPQQEHQLHQQQQQQNVNNNNHGASDYQAIVPEIPSQQPSINNNNSYGTKISPDYETKVSFDGQHIIHIEQSPVIDLSADDNESKDSNPTPVTDESSVILQNADGTYGINATWPDATFVTWPENHDDNYQIASAVSSTIHVAEENQDLQQQSTENITSLLLDVLRRNEKESEFGMRITTTQEPYASFEVTSEQNEKQEPVTTTEEPFLEALMRSYNNFQKEMTEQDKEQLAIDPKEIHPGSGFSASFGIARHMKNNNANRQSGKRNKQVQVIIPYTSQYTPSPFNHAQGSWKDSGTIQSRKVAAPVVKDRSRESTEATEEELAHIFQTLESLPKLKKLAKPFTTTKTNTSIDPLRLQKNIDNWTIQEYSRGTTVIPSSSHHQLSQSKKIPDEYFTTTEPATTSDILAGFSFNDLDHEVSASSRVEISHVQIASSEKAENSLEIEQTTEDVSWEQLPLSISPVSNEKVYIVTPQPPKTAQPKTNATNKDTTKSNSTTQFESIERAYQVLPQAVNNLAVASTGPATLPLWGIMEHEEYASKNATSTSPKTPILYSGHSRVSHTRQ